MAQFKEFAAAIVAALLVLLMAGDDWLPLIPERFTVRWFLLVTTAVAITLALLVAAARLGVRVNRCSNLALME
jgi:hypothetical protein